MVKELRFSVGELEATVEGLHLAMEKLKNGKVKNLEQEVSELNALLAESKRK
jgi:hypothetical protein